MIIEGNLELIHSASPQGSETLPGDITDTVTLNTPVWNAQHPYLLAQQASAGEWIFRIRGMDEINDPNYFAQLLVCVIATGLHLRAPKETCPEYSAGALAGLWIAIWDISHALTRRPIRSLGYGDCGRATPNWDRTGCFAGWSVVLCGVFERLYRRTRYIFGIGSNGALGDVNWPVEISSLFRSWLWAACGSYGTDFAQFDYGLRSGDWNVRIILLVDVPFIDAKRHSKTCLA